MCQPTRHLARRTFVNALRGHGLHVEAEHGTGGNCAAVLAALPGDGPAEQRPHVLITDGDAGLPYSTPEGTDAPRLVVVAVLYDPAAEDHGIESAERLVIDSEYLGTIDAAHHVARVLGAAPRPLRAVA